MRQGDINRVWCYIFPFLDLHIYSAMEAGLALSIPRLAHLAPGCRSAGEWGLSNFLNNQYPLAQTLQFPTQV